MIIATMCVGGMYHGSCYSAVFPETERLSYPYRNDYYVQLGKTETWGILGEEKPAVLILRQDTDSLVYACVLDESQLTGFPSQDTELLWNQVVKILKTVDLKEEDEANDGNFRR